MNSRTLARSGGGRVESCPDSPPPRYFEFACPTCRSKGRTRVLDVDRDEDGHPVRVRRCPNGHKFSTEERIIGVGTSAMLGRAEKRRGRTVRYYRSGKGMCRVCAHPFRRGWYYRRHVTSPEHLAVVDPRSVKQRATNAARTRRAYWRRRYGMEPPPMEPSSNGVLRDELRGVA